MKPSIYSIVEKNMATSIYREYEWFKNKWHNKYDMRRQILLDRQDLKGLDTDTARRYISKVGKKYPLEKKKINKVLHYRIKREET